MESFKKIELLYGIRAEQLESGDTAQSGKTPRFKNEYPLVLMENKRTALQRKHMTTPAFIWKKS